MNERTTDGPLTESEIGALCKSGDDLGLSRKYKPSDDQWSYICEIVNELADKYGMTELVELTPANLQPRKGEGRKAARRLYSVIPGNELDADIDRNVVMMLVRQFLMYDRTEVLANAIIERLNGWVE